MERERVKKMSPSFFLVLEKPKSVFFSVGGIKWTEEKRHRVHFRLLSFFLPFLFGHVTSLILGFRLLERKNVLLVKNTLRLGSLLDKACT